MSIWIQAFWEGALAGYGIAIPIGAIAVLIIDTSMRRGLSQGLQAGAGAATADLIYASAAALGGTLLQSWLEPLAETFRLIGGAVLIVIGVWSQWRLKTRGTDPRSRSADGGKPFLAFLGLTLLNPLTIVYFSALILGDLAADRTWLHRAIFVVGAGLASLSWQWLLAAFGALAGRAMPVRTGRIIGTLGNIVVVFLGVRIIV